MSSSERAALLSPPVPGELWWVGRAMQFGGWCLHLEGEQRHQNAPKTGAFARESEGLRRGNGCTQAV